MKVRIFLFKTFIFASVLFCLLTPSPAWSATDLYVNIEDGVDLDNDGSSDFPWKTLHHAVNQINGMPPDTYVLNVAAGTYSIAALEPDELLTVTQDNVTIQGTNGAVIDGSAVDECNNWWIGIRIAASGVVIKNLEIANFVCEDTGIEVQSGDNNRIESCSIHDNDQGIDINNTATNTKVTGCDISNNTWYGIYLYGPAGIEISGNKLVGNNQYGIHIVTNEPSDNIDIFNNLIYSDIAGDYGISFYTMASSITAARIYHNTIVGVINGINMESYESFAVINADIRYNIIANTSGPGIAFINPNFASYPPNLIDYNNVYNCVPNYSGNGVAAGANDISTDPLYVDEASGNFHLQTASLCLDAIPLDTGDTVTVDLDGNTRPQGLGYDMGAYENPEPVAPPTNNPPAPPTVEGPEDESTFDETDPITLEGSPYSDPDGDLHEKTHWKVWRADSGEIVYEKITDALEKLTLPEPLAPGLKYEWQVGYEDAAEQKSWSDVYSFKVGTSESESLPKIAAGSTLLDFGMISIVHWPDDPSPVKVFNIQYDPLYYRIGTYDPVLGKYIEFDDGLLIKPGRAYWMLAREGIDVNFNGIPVSKAVDIDVGLKFNSSTQNGWNMIACPNEADYYWDDVIVVHDAVEYALSNPAVGTLIDTRLWKWENGSYVPFLPGTSFLMEKYKGYWVKAKASGVSLRFPTTVQASLQNDPPSMLASIKDKFIHYWKMMMPQARQAIAEDQDTPPMPMGALEANDTDNVFSGCFVEILIP